MSQSGTSSTGSGTDQAQENTQSKSKLGIFNLT